MRDKNFDDIIKRKLAGMTDSGQGSDWSAFEQMLDQDQISDQELDDKVSSEMNNMRSPYRHDHWQILHDTLELQKERNNNIIGCKIVELSMLFLLILSANNVYKYMPSSTFEVETPKMYAQTETQSANEEIVNESALISTVVEEESSLVESTIVERTQSAPSLSVIERQQARVEATISIQDVTNATVSSTNMRAAQPVLSKQIIQEKSKVEVINPLLSLSNPLSEVIASRSVFVDNHVAVLANNGLQYERLLDYAPLVIVGYDQITPLVTRDKSRWLSIYGGIDNNLVNSPFDQVYNKNGYETYGMGYTMGAEYSTREKRVELGVGFQYSRRSYDPRYIGETHGNTQTDYFETGLKHIEFHIASIPVSLKYLLVDKPGWIVDFGVGVSANMVAFSDFKIESKQLGFNRPSNNRPINRRGLLIDDKPLEGGVLQGGSINDNLFFTVDASIGFSKQVNNDNYFTIRPEYSFFTLSDGIGPNQDKIHNLSFNLGLKHML